MAFNGPKQARFNHAKWRSVDLVQRLVAQATRYQAYREQSLAVQITRYQAHREQYLAAAAAYYQTHREQCLAAQAAYNKANPEKCAEKARRRRARKLNVPINDFTAAQWKMVQEHFNHRCAYCGKRAKGHLTQDHITPLINGGSHTLSNIVPACRSCNSKKHTGPPLAPVQPLLC